MRRRVGLFVAAVAVVAAAATGCSSDSGDDGGGFSSVPYGARTCSDWAGRLSDSERWDAAEELLKSAKGTVENTDGGRAPSTSTVKQFAADIGTLCDRESGDELLGRLAVQLYESDRAYYSS